MPLSDFFFFFFFWTYQLKFYSLEGKWESGDSSEFDPGPKRQYITRLSLSYFTFLILNSLKNYKDKNFNFKHNMLWIILFCVQLESHTFSLSQLKVLETKNKLVWDGQKVGKSSLDEQYSEIYDSWIQDLSLPSLCSRFILDFS